MTIRCGFVEWPDGLEPFGASWDGVRRMVAEARLDLLVANEMPFGPWMATEQRFDPTIAEQTVALHERGLEALATLDVSAVITSRPVRAGARLANEAFAVEKGQVRTLHRKRCFPEEPGWYEASWFEPGERDSDVQTIAGVAVGVLLCTDLMFTEKARRYGRAGAELIAVPRAAGTSHTKWMTAGAMAAIASGCYVVSANRVSALSGEQTFGGKGFAFAPDGSLLAETSAERPLVVFDLDAELARRQRSAYPCYVAEPGAD